MDWKRFGINLAAAAMTVTGTALLAIAARDFASYLGYVLIVLKG